MLNKLEYLRAKIEQQMYETQYQSAVRTYNGDLAQVEFWNQHIGRHIKVVLVPGKKYVKVDILYPNQSGRYMVDMKTGVIYGVKAYGVPNKNHVYGTLDTVDLYYWGGYTAVK